VSGAERSIARTAALLLPIQIVFRAGEVALPIVLAAWFGRSAATDLFYLYWAYFTFAGSLLSGAFQDSVLVPIVTELRIREPAAVQEVASSLLGHVLLFGGGLALVLGALAVTWAKLGVAPELFATAAALSALFAAHLVVVSVRAVLVAFLNARQKYAAYPVAGGFGFLLAIGVIAVERNALGIASIPLGLLAGELLAIAILTPLARASADIRLRPSLARPEPVRRFFRLAVADVSGATITRINPVIDQLVATTTGIVGGGTILRYATDVGSLPTSLLQATVLPVLLTRLSTAAASPSLAGFEKTVRRTLLVTGALLVGIAVVFGALRTPLLRLVFLHGEMDAGAIAAMAHVLPWALANALPFGALLVLARANVALQNTRFMLALGALNAALNIAFDLVFAHFAGLEGIAFATAAMHLVIAIVFWVALKRCIARRPAA
jgi:putative peptidoglycan lipid II flippase